MLCKFYRSIEPAIDLNMLAYIHTCLFVTILNQKFKAFFFFDKKITVGSHLPRNYSLKGNFPMNIIFFGTISYQTTISKKKYSKKSLFSLDIHSSCFNNFNSFPSFFDCHCYAFYGIFSASSMYFATIRLLIDGFLRK